MAELQFPTGFKITSNDPIDIRLVLTAEQMKTAEYDFAMPDKYFCLCADNLKLYVFDINNRPILDDSTKQSIGRFREVEGQLNLADIDFSKVDELITQYSALANKLNTIKAALEAKDAELETKLDNEIARSINIDDTLAAALANEINTRQNINNMILSKLEEEKAARESADNTEKTERKAADKALGDRITEEAELRDAGDVASLAAVDAEKNLRIVEDSSIRTDVNTKVEELQGVDTALDNRITSEIGTVNDSIASVAQDLSDAETDLNKAISDESDRADAAEKELNRVLGGRLDAHDTTLANLQRQIDTFESKTDVVDIVGTKADLLTYDTSKLSSRAIIKVLTDEDYGGATTFYR